jgi:hypothetical protein
MAFDTQGVADLCEDVQTMSRVLCQIGLYDLRDSRHQLASISDDMGGFRAQD